MSGRRLAVVVTVEHQDDPVLRRFAVPTADVPVLCDALRDGGLGGFDVAFLHDAGAAEAQARITALFEGRDPDDLVLLYFRGIMLTGPGGGLYLAGTDTAMARPAETAVDVAQIATMMQRSRAGQAVVLLDGRTGGPVDAGHHFRAARTAEWQSRVVIATTARPEPPTFAGMIADGIRNGGADRDRDGFVSVGELHDHLRERDPGVRQWVFGSGRQPYVSRVRRPGSDQMTMIAALATAAAGGDLTRAVEARETLRRMTTGEGRVAAAAAAALRRTSVRLTEPALDFGRVPPGTRQLAAGVPVQGPPLTVASAVTSSVEGLHARLEGSVLKVSWFPTAGRLDGVVTLEGPAGAARLVVTGEVSDELEATGGFTPTPGVNGARPAAELPVAAGAAGWQHALPPTGPVPAPVDPVPAWTDPVPARRDPIPLQAGPASVVADPVPPQTSPTPSVPETTNGTPAPPPPLTPTADTGPAEEAVASDPPMNPPANDRPAGSPVSGAPSAPDPVGGAPSAPAPASGPPAPAGGPPAPRQAPPPDGGGWPSANGGGFGWSSPPPQSRGPVPAEPEGTATTAQPASVAWTAAPANGTSPSAAAPGTAESPGVPADAGKEDTGNGGVPEQRQHQTSNGWPAPPGQPGTTEPSNETAPQEETAQEHQPAQQHQTEPPEPSADAEEPTPETAGDPSAETPSPANPSAESPAPEEQAPAEPGSTGYQGWSAAGSWPSGSVAGAAWLRSQQQPTTAEPAESSEPQPTPEPAAAAKSPAAPPIEEPTPTQPWPGPSHHGVAGDPWLTPPTRSGSHPADADITDPLPARPVPTDPSNRPWPATPAPTSGWPGGGPGSDDPWAGAGPTSSAGPTSGAGSNSPAPTSGAGPQWPAQPPAAPTSGASAQPWPPSAPTSGQPNAWPSAPTSGRPNPWPSTPTSGQPNPWPATTPDDPWATTSPQQSQTTSPLENQTTSPPQDQTTSPQQNQWPATPAAQQPQQQWPAEQPQAPSESQAPADPWGQPTARVSTWPASPAGAGWQSTNDWPATPATYPQDAMPGYPATPAAGYPATVRGTAQPGSLPPGSLPPGAPPPGSPPGSVPAEHDPYGEKPRRKTGMALAILLAVVLLAAGSYLGVRLLRSDDTTATPPAEPQQSQQEQPGQQTTPPPANEPPENVPASLTKPVVVDKFSLGQEPEGVVVSPDNKTVYVADQNSKDVHFIDVGSREITKVPVPNTPRFIAVSQDGSRVYASMFENDFTGNGLAVIDTGSRKLVKAIRTGPRPFEPAVGPDGDVWVPIHNGARVEIYDDQSLTESGRISVPPNPHWVTFSPDGTVAYTANHESAQVSVIDTADRLVQRNVKVAKTPHAIALTPDGKKLIVTNYDLDKVQIFDTATMRQIKQISVGREPQAVMTSTDGKHAYVVNEGSDNLSVIDLDEAKVVSTVKVGDSPRVVAISPDGLRLYVTDGRGRTVTVLRTSEK
ncbi:beta-propeller fold lactonase family protein [Actinoplanes sp. NPDC023714]|uniref:beta-propeller fold lactonase family protein n=1 Tax=Actinoplanes sp. NPDC023714 TaxID=3154322 RepID=UPI0033EF08DB